MRDSMEYSSKTPAQLWIGCPNQAAAEVELYVQKVFCVYGGCSTCSVCMQIRQRSYHGCLWFNPMGNYTLDMLKPFFATISRSLMPDEQFYFIFQNADYLSHACSNSLLKSIEEPPQGYHIIFMAQHLKAVAPTLRSRCTIVHCEKNESNVERHELVPFFTCQKDDPELFIQMLEKSSLNDYMIGAMLNEIIAYWCSEYDKAQAVAQPTDDILYRIDYLNRALEKPPMPGSSKIFLKNLFLQLAC